ncbi:MAG TPA: hypothetical protein VIT44_19095 [Cyclobacteriaceae bacterium]
MTSSTDVPQLSFELKDNYLLVVGYGKRDNLIAMNQASAQIYEKVLETKSRCLLMDYRKLQVNLHLSEAFNIVKRYETVLPELRNLKIAGVFTEQGLNFASYWKEVSQQRGFIIEIFEEYEAAEAWLLEQTHL